jgi:hypothetical protein
MTGFDQVAWLPLCAGLTVLGLAGSWLAWRRRGAAAGLRGAAWSLLPLCAYLTGVVELLWQVGTAAARWVADLAFSPASWAGVALTVLAVVLFAVAGLLRRRAPASAPPTRQAVEPGRRAVEPGRAGAAGPGDDGEFAEIEELLRRRGIR